MDRHSTSMRLSQETEELIRVMQLVLWKKAEARVSVSDVIESAIKAFYKANFKEVVDREPVIEVVEQEAESVGKPVEQAVEG